MYGRSLSFVFVVLLISVRAVAFGPVPPTVPANDPYAAAGYLKATYYSGVDPTGVADSTVGLRNALNDGYNYGLAVLLPTGTYLVSDTLQRDQIFQTSGCGQQLNTGTPKNIIKAPIFVGEPGTTRPLIRLKNNSTGFNNPNSPKPVVYFHNHRDDEDDWNGISGCAMGLVFRGIDVDLGVGNSGAVGVTIPSAQNSTIEDVKVTATGAYAGLRGIPTTNVLVNIEVEGGKYGIISGTCCGVSLIGVKLRNQDTAGLLLNNWGAVMVTGFDIQQTTTGIPIQNTMYTSQTSEMALLDGVITVGNGTDPVIANPNGHTLWASNVYVVAPTTGTARPLVKSGSNAAVPGGGTKKISEYSYTNLFVDTQSNGLVHRSYSLINSTTAQSEIVSVAAATSVPTDFVQRHVFGTLPFFNDPGVLNAATLGAIGDGVTDNTAAIQAAINQSNNVFLPRGDYLISGTLNFGANTKLFGTNGLRTRLMGENWNPASQFVPFIRTVNQASAAPYLGDIWIQLPPTAAKSYISGLDWQSGAGSLVRQVAVVAQFEFCAEGQPDSTCYPSQPRKLVHIRNNGGGRWYGLTLNQKGGRIYNADLRGIFIENTTQPLTLYGPNPEHQLNPPFLEMSGAHNVRILGMKTENLSFVIRNSDNIMFAAHTGNSDPYPMMQVLSSSTRVLLPAFSEYAQFGSSQTGRVFDPTRPYIVYDGTNNVGVSGDNRVSLFKLGSFDASVFEPATPAGLSACTAPTSPTIDGSAADWSGVPSTFIPYTRWVSVGGAPSSDTDSSAAFRLKWNSSGLYVLVEVRDELLRGTGPVYVNDGVELYLDGGHERASAYDTNDYQLTVDWRGVVGGARSNQLTFAKAVATTAQGYNVEYSVPWSALTTPSNGKVLGFDIGINDDDGGDGVRDSQLVWFGTGTGWTNPQDFGEISLSGTQCP